MDILFVATMVAMNAAIHIDHMQTKEIARNPAIYHEHNPILGRHPREVSVNRYFWITHVLATGVMFALPGDYGITFGCIATTVETGFIMHNRSIGLSISF